jgi:hypothetical protein
MPKFRVEFTETLKGFRLVEAKDLEEAQELFHNGEGEGEEFINNSYIDITDTYED